MSRQRGQPQRGREERAGEGAQPGGRHPTLGSPASRMEFGGCSTTAGQVLPQPQVAMTESRNCQPREGFLMALHLSCHDQSGAVWSYKAWSIPGDHTL